MAFARFAQRRRATDERTRAALPGGPPEACVPPARPARLRPLHVALLVRAGAAAAAAVRASDRASGGHPAAVAEHLGAPVEMRVARPELVALVARARLRH